MRVVGPCIAFSLPATVPDSEGASSSWSSHSHHVFSSRGVLVTVVTELALGLDNNFISRLAVRAAALVAGIGGVGFALAFMTSVRGRTLLRTVWMHAFPQPVAVSW